MEPNKVHGIVSDLAARFEDAAAGAPSWALDFAAFVSSFGAVRLMGGSPEFAYAVQGVASLGAAALVGRALCRDRAFRSDPRRPRPRTARAIPG